MDRTFILRKHYEIFDTQMEELIESRNNECEIKEQDLRAEITIEEKEPQEKIIIIETERIYEFDINDEVDDEYRRIWSETNIKKKILTEQETREWLKNYINNVDTHTLIYHGEKQSYTRNEFITFVNNAAFEIIVDTEYNFHYFYQEDMKQTRTNIKFKRLDK